MILTVIVTQVMTVLMHHCKIFLFLSNIIFSSDLLMTVHLDLNSVVVCGL